MSTPEPVDFREFLDEVNAARKAVANQAEPIEIPAAYTPDFHEQNSTFTEAEMELLTTAHDPEEDLTREDLIADAETFFTLLQTTYGAYHYFGGDDTFLPLLDAVKEELAAAERPTVKALEEILYQHLSPVLVDGHFTLGSHPMRNVHSLYMYYVPDLYLDSPEGVESPGYIKPTIGPDGRICWWYAALSHDGTDLPDALDGNPLTWKRALSTENSSEAPAFSRSEWEGIPILTSRRMSASQSLGALDINALQDLSSCGGEYAASPLLIFDARGNGGGSDRYIDNWFLSWSGAGSIPRRTAGGPRYSQLSCRIFSFYPTEHMGTYGSYSSTGTWVERSGPTFVLQDKGVASSGETAIRNFRTAADVLFVGGPTLGCSLTPNNLSVYLPHSGLSCFFGTGLLFLETGEDRDGFGFLPDLWVEPTQAMVLVKALIGYYGLYPEQ